jgi:hypothetical protein
VILRGCITFEGVLLLSKPLRPYYFLTHYSDCLYLSIKLEIHFQIKGSLQIPPQGVDIELLGSSFVVIRGFLDRALYR